MKEQMILLWSDSLFTNLNSNVGVTVLLKTLIKYSPFFSDELGVKQIACCLAQVMGWINDCHLHWYLLSLFHSCLWVLCVLWTTWLPLSSSSTSPPCPGRGHHCDAGEKDASLSMASLWDLWVQVRARGPLVPAVSDNVYAELKRVWCHGYKGD